MCRILNASTPWERDHVGVILAGQAYQAAHEGSLPTTPVWRMLEARYDLNPARFTRWHPTVARMISGRYSSSPIIPPHHWTGCMRGPTTDAPSTVVPPDPPPVVAAGVPEPSSLMMLGAIVFAFWAYCALRGIIDDSRTREAGIIAVVASVCLASRARLYRKAGVKLHDEHKDEHKKARPM